MSLQVAMRELSVWDHSRRFFQTKLFGVFDLCRRSLFALSQRQPRRRSGDKEDIHIQDSHGTASVVKEVQT